jgi:hypothetical protein
MPEGEGPVRYYLGVDWADQTHAVWVGDERGTRITARVAELRKARNSGQVECGILDLNSGRDRRADRVSFAKTPSGGQAAEGPLSRTGREGWTRRRPGRSRSCRGLPSSLPQHCLPSRFGIRGTQ